MTLSYEDIRKNSTLFQVDGCEYTHLLIYRQWRFFYALEGEMAPFDVTDSNDDSIPDYIELMLYKFETAKILLTKSFDLRDPLEGGFFFDKGVEFIDIYLRDIPREHGIASGIVYHQDIEALQNTPYNKKSLRITIHRNLIKKTATPIHELFHIFQYSYAHFNNMWFMEGLARWSQSIMQEKTGTCEPLPRDHKELDTLVHKLHDAEFFFNQLIALCDTKHTFTIPSELENNSEIYNNKKAGSKFIKIFLQNCEKQIIAMQQTLQKRELSGVEYWKRQEKRSTNNNQYIFQALLQTIKELDPPQNDELSRFIELIRPLAVATPHTFNTPQIQNFLRVLKKTHPRLVQTTEHGLLYSEFFDIFTGTLSCENIRLINTDLDDDALETFHLLKRINGSLEIKNCQKLTSLQGLRNLISIEGNLRLDTLNIEKLNELNNLSTLHELQIHAMNALESINGFNGLSHIRSNLLITNNPSLKKINGFNTLETITKDISIKNNAALRTINGFNTLCNVKNIEIANTQLEDAGFLRHIIKKHPKFGGFIKITNNQIQDIAFMQGIQEIASSLFLHQNNIVSLEGLENLKSVGASLSLSTNQIQNLKPLSNLNRVNGLLALSYNKLKSLNGLQNLKSIVTKKWGDAYFSLKIYGNKDLVDISALENLQTPDNYLIIYYDSTLNYSSKPKEDSNFHKNILELHDFTSKKLIPTYQFVTKHTHDYSKFRAATHNKVLTSLFDFEIADADILVLSFTGAFGNLGGLFHNKFPLLIDNLKTHKIFIMDPTHTWYNKGFAPFTKNMDENIVFLKELIKSKRYRKVVCMGTSMGAYFSLLLGCVLENEVHEVLAFSPQTFMDEANRKKTGDTRWATLVPHFPSDTKQEYLDLKILFEKYQNYNTIFNIHYATQERLDKQHIEHLPQQKNINLIPYEVNDHYITIMLHKQNKLNPIIIESLKEK